MLLILQNGQEILDNLAELKPGIVDRYEKWRQAQSDGVDLDTTPNARNQQLANENAARLRAQQESRIRDEEAARAHRQLKEQERVAAEEASRWVQQRQQLEQETRRQEMASAAIKSPGAPKVLPQPPDLTFSRPNVQMAVPGHGSQSTVVLMDGQGQGRGPVDPSRNNQQEQKRQREEEISRKRREEQEGIARRQYESEEAARAVRQNLASPNLPYSPNSSTSSTNAQQPFSLFPTHLGASSSTVPKSMFYPTAVQYPKLGPTAMPLESPHYEGDSTDSESLHQDFRRLGMDSNGQRSPLKPVRK